MNLQKTDNGSTHRNLEPREVDSYPVCSKSSPELEGAQGSKVRDDHSSSSSDEDEAVISYSKLQRWPHHGEPVCVVCGRYGAYIVDKTNQDVCSLECKARHLIKMGLPLTPSSATAPEESREDEIVKGWSYREHPEVAGMTPAQVDALRVKVSARFNHYQVCYDP